MNRAPRLTNSGSHFGHLRQLSKASQRRSIAVGAVVFAASAFVAAGSARAEFPLPLPHEIHREVRQHARDVLRTIGRIPERIHREHQRHLDVFSGGNEYYRSHRHNHATYNFPVWIDGNVDYRRYSYCNDRLYGNDNYRPQVWVGWGQETQGHWCNHHRGYYPNRHSCFRSGPGRRSTRDYGDYGYYDGSLRYQQHQEWQGSGYRQDSRRYSQRHSSQPQWRDHRRSDDRGHSNNWNRSRRSDRPTHHQNRSRGHSGRRGHDRDDD